MDPRPRPRGAGPIVRGIVATLVLGALVAGCESGSPAPTASLEAGRPDAPRELNLIARDYSFDPPTLDVIPGETVLLHVVNAGLAVHEAVIGDATVQDAWEAAEAPHADPPPGPTPLVTVPADVAGIRVVVESGQRVDVRWEVPAGEPELIVGCHIPGHWERGMRIPVRWVAVPGAASPAI